LSGSTDATVRLWKLDSGEQVRSFEQGAPITALAISPDGKSAAIGAKNKAIRIWNLSEGKIIHELKGDYRTRYSLTDSERALSYAKTLNSYRKDRLAAAEKERESQVERVGKAGAAKSAAEKALADKEKELKTASDNHAAAEKSLAEARDGLKALREKSETAEAVLLKAKAAAKDALQKVLDEKLKEHADGIRAEFDRILTNSLARLAAIGTNEPAAKNPDAAPAKTNSTSLAGNAFDKILDEITSKSGAAALASKALAETKPEAEKKEKELDEKVKSAQKAFAGLEKALRPLRLTNSASANELTFAIGAAQKALDGATDAQNALQLAEAELKRQETFLATAQANFTNSAQLSVSLAFSPDGSLLAAAEGDGQIGLWSAQTGSPLDNVKAAPSGVELRAGLVTFSKNNALTIFEQGKLQVVDAVPSWKLERTIGSPGGDSVFADRVNAVRFSPDGQLLATGGGEPSRSGELKLFRVKDGQLTQEFKNLHSDVVLSLAFTPDGRYLASGAADRFAKVTELATGKLVRALEGHTHHVLALTWKRDGHTLMTGGADNIIKVWDVFSGEKKKNIEGFNKEVTSVSFIADTDQALACSGDNTVRLVKENGEKIKSFEGGADFLEAALPTPDGKLILAGGQDGVLRIWENESGKLIASYSGR
ncbi:MAG TPA: hypothetical protein VGR78_19535, partial [Verrucomicrobiae bacterium]|nr:hypothetical protein [Verrucomicrobiae bacterium]